MLSGTDKHGFAVLRSSPLPELEAVMHYMRHCLLYTSDAADD